MYIPTKDYIFYPKEKVKEVALRKVEERAKQLAKGFGYHWEYVGYGAYNISVNLW